MLGDTFRATELLPLLADGVETGKNPTADARTPSGGMSAGNGILKVAALVGVGSGTVQRVKREMAGKLAAIVCHSRRSVRDPSLFR
jgi:hypothetical protein